MDKNFVGKRFPNIGNGNIGYVQLPEKSPCLCSARHWICCTQPGQELSWETSVQSIQPWSRNNKVWVFGGVYFPSAGPSLFPWIRLSSDFLGIAHRALRLGRHQHTLNSFPNKISVAETSALWQEIASWALPSNYWLLFFFFLRCVLVFSSTHSRFLNKRLRATAIREVLWRNLCFVLESKEILPVTSFCCTAFISLAPHRSGGLFGLNSRFSYLGNTTNLPGIRGNAVAKCVC